MTDANFASGEAFSPDDSSSIDTAAPATKALDILAAAQRAAVDAEAQTAPQLPLDNGFVRMGLAEPLVRACADLGFTEPTVVQAQAIPKAMPARHAGNTANSYQDLMVSSRTGSGKTAAFLLPVLHTLLQMQEEAVEAERQAQADLEAAALARGEPLPKKARRKDPTNPRHFKAAQPGALILCPTRELAQQVANDAIDLVRHCRGLRIANIVGGMPYQMQIARLQNANLVVATPGRLLDLQRSMHIKLDEVRFLVVDEADRMLDLGFADDLAEVHSLTAARQQTMMFSATLAPRIQQLAARVMRTPERLQIDTPQEKHSQIKQVLFWADNAQHKRKLLDHWLRDTGIDQAIVFASTQIECDGLATDLQQAGFDAVALHGALSQGLRNRRLTALRDGRVQILVATDVAARGIDVPTITHVFNYGLPMKAEDYTHRIGRTGRADREGLAVTFAEFRERRKIMDIEFFTKQPIRSEVVPGLEPQAKPVSSPRPSGRGFGGPRSSEGGGRGGDFRSRAPRGAPRADGRVPGWGDEHVNRGGSFAGPRDGDAGHRAAPSFAPRDRDARPAGAGGGFRSEFRGEPRTDRAPSRGAPMGAPHAGGPARRERPAHAAAPRSHGPVRSPR